jgi:hypothetical protein
MRYDADDYEPDTGPPWTCPDCDADTQQDCHTCHGEGEVYEEGNDDE